MTQAKLLASSQNPAKAAQEAPHCYTHVCNTGPECCGLLPSHNGRSSEDVGRLVLFLLPKLWCHTGGAGELHAEVDFGNDQVFIRENGVLTCSGLYLYLS